MAKINLKCDQCGGNLVLGENKVSGICERCQSETLIKEDIIHNVHNTTQHITKNVYGGSSGKDVDDYVADGEAFLAAGEISLANEAFEKAIKRDPKNLLAWLNYGISGGKDNSPGKAFLAAYNLATSDEARDLIVKSAFGQFEESDDSIVQDSIAQALLKMDSDNFYGFYAAGFCNARDNNLDEALQFFLEAYKNAPDDGWERSILNNMSANASHGRSIDAMHSIAPTSFFYLYAVARNQFAFLEAYINVKLKFDLAKIGQDRFVSLAQKILKTPQWKYGLKHDKPLIPIFTENLYKAYQAAQESGNEQEGQKIVLDFANHKRSIFLDPIKKLLAKEIKKKR
jgi:tetratricopeptide (TPR) repeat protein